MARPIRNTPMLFGKDATEFLLRMENLPPIEERRARRKRMLEAVERLEKIAETWPDY